MLRCPVSDDLIAAPVDGQLRSQLHVGVPVHCLRSAHRHPAGAAATRTDLCALLVVACSRRWSAHHHDAMTVQCQIFQVRQPFCGDLLSRSTGVCTASWTEGMKCQHCRHLLVTHRLKLVQEVDSDHQEHALLAWHGGYIGCQVFNLPVIPAAYLSCPARRAIAMLSRFQLTGAHQPAKI